MSDFVKKEAAAAADKRDKESIAQFELLLDCQLKAIRVVAAAKELRLYRDTFVECCCEMIGNEALDTALEAYDAAVKAFEES